MKMRPILFLAPTVITVGSLTSPGETYQSWTARHFSPAQIAAGLAAPHGDQDGDLCPNILEYCADTDPADSGTSFALTWDDDPGLGEVTVRFPFAPDREDMDHLVLVSNDLSTWFPRAVFVGLSPSPTYHLNGYRYAKAGVRPKPGVMLDSDQDGLSDFFEESLTNADPADAFTHIGQILPDDDFDGDGTSNVDEEENCPASPTFGRPPLLDPESVARALHATPPPVPHALVVHTILK